jgi:hypothetical protein
MRLICLVLRFSVQLELEDKISLRTSPRFKDIGVKSLRTRTTQKITSGLNTSASQADAKLWARHFL